jgi:hypothetical protein
MFNLDARTNLEQPRPVSGVQTAMKAL